MANRTFAIGDVHGDSGQLRALMAQLPELTADDTLLFLGDYVDRGPDSAGVLDYVRHTLPATTPARLVTLRGNHEDAWLKIVSQGWLAYVIVSSNGCLSTMRSFVGGPPPDETSIPPKAEFEALMRGSFLPADVVDWMRQLPYWYEDEHALYVHAGLPMVDGDWVHPSQAKDPSVLVWTRDERFFRDYEGKLVVCGHTPTKTLPPELSSYTPKDPTDTWAHGGVIAIDTGCGQGGFLTALELPALRVYESRRP